MCSCVVTSGRQRGGGGADEESQSPFLYYQLEGWKPQGRQTCDQVSQAFLYLHTAGDQRLDEVGMAWELD